MFGICIINLRTRTPTYASSMKTYSKIKFHPSFCFFSFDLNRKWMGPIRSQIHEEAKKA